MHVWYSFFIHDITAYPPLCVSLRFLPSYSLLKLVVFLVQSRCLRTEGVVLCTDCKAHWTIFFFLFFSFFCNLGYINKTDSTTETAHAPVVSTGHQALRRSPEQVSKLCWWWREILINYFLHLLIFHYDFCTDLSNTCMFGPISKRTHHNPCVHDSCVNPCLF